MKIRTLVTVLLATMFASTAFAQQNGSTTTNPLDDLYERVKKVLADAAVPFGDEQEKAIVLMMEDRRAASEELFGQTMDFRGGPVQGQQLDRAVAAIQWMEGEFTKRIGEYLTPQQVSAWETYQTSLRAEQALGRGRGGRGSNAGGRQQQTQFVRINNNAFTAENGFFGGGGGPGGGGPGGGGPGGGGPGGGGGRGGPPPGGGRGGGRGGAEVIERGGTGAYHGQMSFNLQDSKLNAKNHFASNKPPYQERQINANFSGPIIPGRLTASFSFSQNEAQNYDTVHATLPDAIFELGVVHPNVNRSGGMRGTYQFNDKHSLIFNVRYGTNVQKNNQVGGFTLPERASDTHGNNHNYDLRQFSVFSDALLYEQSVSIQTMARKNQPLSEGMAINVLDAFRGGGGQDKSETSSLDYTFGNLLTRMGSTWTIKTGLSGGYRTSDDLSANNFTGTYTFTSLDEYIAGTASQFRVTRGEPRIGITQLELSPFMQNDFKVSQQLTLMFGARYEYQTNLNDHNNIAPRFGLAWALGRGLVIRGGSGIFYERLQDNIVQSVRRQDGTRQWEIIITNPSYPDPFESGDLTIKYPTSVRLTDPNLIAPYSFVVQGAIEKTFRNNLFVSASFNRNRGVHQLRSHDLNAPLPDETSRPDITRGQVLQLESNATTISHSLSFNVSRRFSRLNVSGSYSYGEGKSNTDGWMFNPSDNYNLDADWGAANGRQRNSFNASANVQLPMGLFLTASHFWNGGQPYNITTGKDNNHDGVYNDRPAGTPRNHGKGPGSYGTSFNISKAVYFGTQGQGGSGTNLNWFVNLSNAFNVVNYRTPSGVMTSPNFGKSTSAQPPRELEVGLRFNF